MEMERSLFRNNNVISFWEVIKDPETNIADIMFGIDEKYSVKKFVCVSLYLSRVKQ